MTFDGTYDIHTATRRQVLRDMKQHRQPVGGCPLHRDRHIFNRGLIMRETYYDELKTLERLYADRSAALGLADADVELTREALIEAETNHRNARIEQIEAAARMRLVTARIEVVKQMIREVL